MNVYKVTWRYVDDKPSNVEVVKLSSLHWVIFNDINMYGICDEYSKISDVIVTYIDIDRISSIFAPQMVINAANNLHKQLNRVEVINDILE